jgi:hypothetical protein
MEVPSAAKRPGQAIDETLLAVECLTLEECKDLVRFFPL